MTKATDPTHISDTIVLDYPIKDGHGKTINELHMRRPKIKDQRDMTKKNGDDKEAFEVELFARLCGITIEDIDQLDLLDYAKLGARFRNMVNPPNSD